MSSSLPITEVVALALEAQAKSLKETCVALCEPCTRALITRSNDLPLTLPLPSTSRHLPEWLVLPRHSNEFSAAILTRNAASLRSGAKPVLPANYKKLLKKFAFERIEADADTENEDAALTQKRPAKKAKVEKDPNFPRRPQSAFLLYMSEKRASLKSADLGSKMTTHDLKTMWDQLDAASKAVRFMQR